jgi:predicted nucleic acid-binding Zn ribbon protein
MMSLLGPGRIHHRMRTIGAAEKALGAMCRRLLSRYAFSKPLAEHSDDAQRRWSGRDACARDCARRIQEALAPLKRPGWPNE